MDLHNVLNCVCEKDQVHHLATVHHVEVFKLAVALLLHALSIGELAVNLRQRLLRLVVVRVDRGHETAEEEWLDLYEIVKVLLKLTGSLLRHQ